MISRLWNVEIGAIVKLSKLCTSNFKPFTWCFENLDFPTPTFFERSINCKFKMKSSTFVILTEICLIFIIYLYGQFLFFDFFSRFFEKLWENSFVTKRFLNGQCFSFFCCLSLQNHGWLCYLCQFTDKIDFYLKWLRPAH